MSTTISKQDLTQLQSAWWAQMTSGLSSADKKVIKSACETYTSGTLNGSRFAYLKDLTNRHFDWKVTEKISAAELKSTTPFLSDDSTSKLLNLDEDEKVEVKASVEAINKLMRKHMTSDYLGGLMDWADPSKVKKSIERAEPWLRPARRSTYEELSEMKKTLVDWKCLLNNKTISSEFADAVYHQVALAPLLARATSEEMYSEARKTEIRGPKGADRWRVLSMLD